VGADGGCSATGDVFGVKTGGPVDGTVGYSLAPLFWEGIGGTGGGKDDTSVVGKAEKGRPDYRLG
jgi:hypothetical protein